MFKDTYYKKVWQHGNDINKWGGGSRLCAAPWANSGDFALYKWITALESFLYSLLKWALWPQIGIKVHVVRVKLFK